METELSSTYLPSNPLSFNFSKVKYRLAKSQNRYFLFGPQLNGFFQKLSFKCFHSPSPTNSDSLLSSTCITLICSSGPPAPSFILALLLRNCFAHFSCLFSSPKPPLSFSSKATFLSYFLLSLVSLSVHIFPPNEINRDKTRTSV